MKKQSDFSRLMGDMRVQDSGFHYACLGAGLRFSALVALVPFVYIWKILRDVLTPRRTMRRR